MNFSERREKLLDELAGVNIAAALVQNLENIYYLSGYSAPSASRPFGLLFSRDKTVLIAPMTSSDDAKAEAEGLEILTYYEHPAGEGRRFSFY
ncbi:MAG: aminopeptidase P family N-terminal domain-containing protein, partial [Synergistaceae bacterium]|nr:aminopeptidase P family N-terminal domain-containing protein [Synergistaceae bacterium]